MLSFPMTVQSCAAMLLAVSLAGCSDATGLIPRVHQRWYKTQLSYGLSRPAASGDLVFFATGDGQVIARKQSTGDEVWATKISLDQIYGANLVVRDGVLAVSVIRTTVGLDIAAGQQLWSYNAPLDTLENSGPAALPGNVARAHLDADSNTVFVPAWGATVSALDLRTGATRWVWQFGRVGSDTAARAFRSGSQGVTAAGDTVYATLWHFRDFQGLASEAWLVALDRLTGQELWRVALPTYTGGTVVWGRPVVAGNLIIFDGRGGHAFAIDRNTQQLAWEYKPHTTNATFAQIEFFGGSLYLDGGDHSIYALRASDGSVLWRAPFTSQASQDLLATERRVYFSDGPTLYVVDRLTGRNVVDVQQPHAGDSFFGSPASFANGQIFVTVDNGAWSFDEP
jgi:outer membrane protein assembly factor BamB